MNIYEMLFNPLKIPTRAGTMEWREAKHDGRDRGRFIRLEAAFRNSASIGGWFHIQVVRAPEGAALSGLIFYWLLAKARDEIGRLGDTNGPTLSTMLPGDSFDNPVIESTRRNAFQLLVMGSRPNCPEAVLHISIGDSVEIACPCTWPVVSADDVEEVRRNTCVMLVDAVKLFREGKLSCVQHL